MQSEFLLESQHKKSGTIVLFQGGVEFHIIVII